MAANHPAVPGAKPGQASGRIAVFAGSFDPLTLGHLDIIRRASKLFDHVIVAVGTSRGKTPLLTTEERLALIGGVCAAWPNVSGQAFQGLAADFSVAVGASVLVRGVRSEADYAYEVQMALMNHALKPQLETIFFPTSPEFIHISSSLAKDIARHGGPVDLLVPPLVAQKLAEKTFS